jgi:hypothetical protein
MLIICGSAREDGDTGRAVERLCAHLPGPPDRIDLSKLRVAPFDYDRPAHFDRFDEVVAAMLAHREILFATPVYWYAMSAQLKALFDRFTDLLSDRDPQRRGRALAGRGVWLMAVGTDPDMPPGFETPFSHTASYLDMRWRGSLYLPRGADRASELAAFAARLVAQG